MMSRPSVVCRRNVFAFFFSVVVVLFVVCYLLFVIIADFSIGGVAFASHGWMTMFCCVFFFSP